MKRALALLCASTGMLALFACVSGSTIATRLGTPKLDRQAEDPAQSGEREARRDLAAGHYAILFYGLPAPWAMQYFSILNSRYGVEVRVVGGCVVTEELVQHARSYNAISTAAAKQKFGRDIFEEAEHEAQRDWETKRQDAPPDVEKQAVAFRK